MQCYRQNRASLTSMKRYIKLIWVLPITLLGLCFSGIICLSGGRISKHGDAWEATGGAASRLLWLFNPWINIEAITLGHIIIARDDVVAACLRSHEHAHVRQYERWGMLFPLAYLLAGALATMRGGDAYRDNAFEVEARNFEVKRS